jgi:tetratricopeptide (TPR) repeat protein
VTRVYGSDAVEGRYIGPQAYASFLAGAIAEAKGDLAAALGAYEAALGLDGGSPELWTRIGAVRCRLDPRDPKADVAFHRALEGHPLYGPAWAAQARCLTARGDPSGARHAAEEAMRIDPEADAANILVLHDGAADPAVREKLVALTLTAEDREAAWDALAHWAQAHGDLILLARASRELARVAPGRRDAVADVAEFLAGMGAVPEAREVAMAAVEGDPAPMGGAAHELARRLALDAAIATGKADRVRNVASRARVPVDEAAGRALLAGKRELARSLAEVEASGDPTARGARWVLAVCTGGGLLAAATLHEPGVEPAGAAWVAFARGLVREVGAESARLALGGMPKGAIVAGDDMVVRPAVDLAWRGVLDASALPADGALELAVLRGENAAPASPAKLDARHEYLAFALAGTDPQRARALGERLSREAPGDAIVLAARGLEALHSREAVAPGSAAALLRANPADPLLAAVALRLAERAGEGDVVAKAKAVMAAVVGYAPSF